MNPVVESVSKPDWSALMNDFRLIGLNYREIANELGLSVGHAHKISTGETSRSSWVTGEKIIRLHRHYGRQIAAARRRQAKRKK